MSGRSTSSAELRRWWCMYDALYQYMRKTREWPNKDTNTYIYCDDNCMGYMNLYNWLVTAEAAAKATPPHLSSDQIAALCKLEDLVVDGDGPTDCSNDSDISMNDVDYLMDNMQL